MRINYQDSQIEEDRELPKFDADLSPSNPKNVEAAKARGLEYDGRRRVYVDEDWCPTLDQFGQPLG